MFIIKAGIFVVFESASVRLPAIVTWCLLLVARLKVTVAQSLAVAGRRVCESVIPSTAITPAD